MSSDTQSLLLWEREKEKKREREEEEEEVQRVKDSTLNIYISSKVPWATVNAVSGMARGRGGGGVVFHM